MIRKPDVKKTRPECRARVSPARPERARSELAGVPEPGKPAAIDTTVRVNTNDDRQVETIEVLVAPCRSPVGDPRVARRSGRIEGRTVRADPRKVGSMHPVRVMRSPALLVLFLLATALPAFAVTQTLSSVTYTAPASVTAGGGGTVVWTFQLVKSGGGANGALVSVKVTETGTFDAFGKVTAVSLYESADAVYGGDTLLKAGASFISGDTCLINAFTTGAQINGGTLYYHVVMTVSSFLASDNMIFGVAAAADFNCGGAGVALGAPSASEPIYVIVVPSGQTTLLSQGIENAGAIPAGWTEADTSGTVGDWTFVTTTTLPTLNYAREGSYFAKFNSYTAAAGDATRIYSGSFSTSGYSSCQVVVYVYHDTSYTTKNDRIQVATSPNGTAWTNQGSAVARYDGSTGWKAHTITLTGVDDQGAVYVGFEGISDYGANTLMDYFVLTGVAIVPTVTAVVPNIGVTAGGTSITVTGTNFKSPMTATVGGNPAGGVTVVSSTELTCTTPAGAGTVDVVATRTDNSQSGTLTGGFTYTDAAKDLTDVTTAQASTATVAAGAATDYAVLRLAFAVTGTSGGLTLQSMTFTSANLSDADVAASTVRLFRTGYSSTFSTATQLGTDQSFSGGSVTFSSLAWTLEPGTTYIWLSYRIAAGAMPGNTVDARIASSANITVDTDSTFTFSGNPAGSRTILAATTKNWNGGGWNLRQVLSTDPPGTPAGATIRIRLDGASATTIWNEALGSTAAAKANSVRVFRNSGGTWAELQRDLFAFHSSRCYLDFQTPGGHVAGDLYYLASGGSMSGAAQTYTSLTWAVIDTFEDGDLAGWTTSGANVTNSTNGSPPQGSRAMEIVDSSAASAQSGQFTIAPGTRFLLRYWARNSISTTGCIVGGLNNGTSGFTCTADIDSSIPGFAVNTWYSITIDGNETTRVYDTYVNGEAFAVGAAYLNPNATDRFIAYTGRGGNAPLMTSYVDDIQLASYDSTSSHSLGAVVAGDGLWLTAVNWEPAGAPGAANHALVSGGSFTYQPTVNAGGDCASLVLGSGNSIAVTGGTLSLAGTLNVSNGTLTMTGGTLRFAGSTDLNFVGPASQTLASLTVDSGAYAVFVGTTSVTMTGSLALASGTLNLGTGVHTLQGDLSRTTGSIAATAYTFQATGGADQTWTVGAFSLGNLTLSKSAGTVTLSSSDLTVSSRLTLSSSNAGNLDLGGGTHSLNGTNDSATEGTGSFVINGGRLDISTSTATSQAKLNVGTGGTVRMNGGGTLKLPANGADIYGAFRAAVTASGRPTVTRLPAGSPYAFVFRDNATVDLYGLNFDYPNSSGMQVLDVDGSGITRIDDVSYSNGDPAAGSCYLHFSGLNSGSYTFRLLAFDASCPITVRLRSGNTDGTPNPLGPASTAQLRMENAGGDRGDNLATTGGGIAEDFDGDPDLDSHITWVYFKRWLGAVNTVWSVGPNWEGGAAPDPNANSGAGEDVLIAVAANSPTLDQNWRVRSFSIASGATFNLGSYTLTITGDNFQAFGGIFNPGTGTVALSGTVTQVINVGTNPLYNFIIDKSGGTANLATNLTIQNILRIIDGTFDLRGYQLYVGDGLGDAGQDGLVYVNDERTSGDVTTAYLAEADTPTVPDADGSIVGGTTSCLDSRGYARVRGNASFRGSLSLSGNAQWLARAEVNPSGSSVSGGQISLSGSAVLTLGTATVAGAVQIPANGILSLTGGCTMKLDTTTAGAAVTVSGTFQTGMSGSTKPTVTRSGSSGTFSFTVNGTVDVAGLKFSRAGDNGLDITSSATLTRLNSIEFTNGSTNAGARHLRIVRAVTSSFLSEACTFDNSTSPPYYVTLDDGAFTFTLYMSNATGAATGLNDTNIGTREQELNGGTITWVDQRKWAGNWQYRRLITVSNGSASVLNAGAPVELTFDHNALRVAGKSRADGDDIRVVYWDGATGRELDRVLFKRYNNTGWDTSQCTIVFPTFAFAPIGPSPATDANYYVYYGNASAGSPPASAANVGVVFTEGWESNDWVAGGWSEMTTSNQVLSASFNSGAKSGGWNLTGTYADPSSVSKEIALTGLSNVRLYYARKVTDPSGPAQVGYESAYTSGGETILESNTNAGTLAFTLVQFSLPNTATKIRIAARLNGYVGSETLFDDLRIYANHNGTLPGTTSFDAAGEQTQTGKWGDPFNWTPPGVPTSNSAVTIDQSAVAYQYAPNQNTGSAQTVLSLTIGDVTVGGLTLTNALTVTRDVAVDTNGAQTAMTLTSDLTVGGDIVYTEGAFGGAGTVRLNRASTQDQHIRGTGSPSFPNLATQDASVRALIDTDTTVAGVLTLGSAGSTDEIEISAGKTLRIVGNSTVKGRLDIEPTAILSLSSNTFTVVTGGTLEAVGTSDSARAKIYDTSAGGGYSLTVDEGGTINANWYDFSEPGVSGLKLGVAGAGNVAITSLDNGWLHKPAANGVLLNTSQLNGWAGAFTGTITGCKFELDGGGANPAAVQGGTEATLHGLITMSTYVGDLATDENNGANTDANNLITWGVVTVPAIVDQASPTAWARAEDTSSGGAGIQAGDRVYVLFDAATNAPTVTDGAWLNTNLPVSGRTWGNIQSGTWSTTTNANDTLTISLGTGSDIVVTDGITMPGGGAIKDVTAASSATGSTAIKGTFGADTPHLVSLVAEDLAGSPAGGPDAGGSDGSADRVKIAFDKNTNKYAITSGTINTILPLNGGSKNWGDSCTATWTLSDFSTPAGASSSRWLLVTLGGSGITIDIGDSLSIAAGTVRDSTNTNSATGSPPSLTGTFGPVTILTAVAQNTGGAGGPGTGDSVKITFDYATNAYAVTTANINTLLPTVSPANAWGTTSTLSAVWSNSNRTLTVTFTAVGDASITPGSTAIDTGGALVGGAAPNTICEPSGATKAGGLPKTITGDFGTLPAPVVLSAIAEDSSGQGPGVQNDDRVVITFDVDTNQPDVTTGAAQNYDTDTNLPLDNSPSPTWGDVQNLIASAHWVNSRTLVVKLAGANTAITTGTTRMNLLAANLVKSSDGLASSTGWPMTITGSFGAGWVLTLYTDATEAANLGVNVAVRLLKSGSSIEVKATDATGKVSFGGVAPGDTLLFYRDQDHALDTTGEAAANLLAGATVAGSSDGALKLYRNKLTVQNDDGGSTTNATLNTAKGAYADADIPYIVSGGNLTLTAGMALRVRGNFNPGGTITLSGAGGDLEVAAGTFTIGDNLAHSLGSANLTVSGGTMDFGAVATGTSLTIPGTTTISGGTLSFGTGGGARTLTCTGAATHSAGTIDFGSGTGVRTLACSAAYTKSGTGTFTMDEDTKEIFSVAGLCTWSGGTLTMSAGTIDLNGNMSITGGSVAGISGGTITCAGNWDDSGGDGFFQPTAGVVRFDRAAGTSTLAQATSNYFNNLEIATSGGGDVEPTAGSAVVDVNGNLTLTSGVYDDAANDKGMEIAGNWVNSVGTGAFVADGAAVDFNGASTQTIGGTANTTFYNLTLGNSTATGTDAYRFGNDASARTFTVSNAVTWTSGDLRVGQAAVADTVNLSLAGASLTVPSGFTLKMAGTSVLNVGGTTGTNGVNILGTGSLILAAGGTSAATCEGNWTRAGTATFTPNTSTVTFSGSAAQTIGAAETFYGLAVNNGSNSLKITDGTTVTVSGTFTETGAAVITGTGTAGYGLTLNGNISVSTAMINYANPVTIGGAGTVTFDGVTFGNFIDAAGAKSLYVTRALVAIFDACSFGSTGARPDGADSYNVHVNNASTAIYFTTSAGAGAGESKDNDQAGYAHWVDANQKYWRGGTSVSWNTGGNWVPSGVPGGTDSVFIVDGNTFDCTQDVAATVAGLTIQANGSLTVSTTAAQALTVNGAFSQTSGVLVMADPDCLLDVNGAFTITGGADAPSDGEIRVSGNVAVSGGSTFVAAGNTPVFTLDGGAGTTVTLTGASNTFGMLNVSKTTSTDLIQTAGNVTAIRMQLAEGEFQIMGHTVTVSDVSDVQTFQIQAGSKLRMDTVGGVLDVEGNFALSASAASEVAISNGTIYIGRDIVVNAAATFAPTGGTIIFDRATIHDLLMEATDNLWNVEFRATGGGGGAGDKVQPDATLAAGSVIKINGNLDIVGPAAGSTPVWTMVDSGGDNCVLDLGGNFTLSNAGVAPTFTSGTGSHTVGGGWDDSGGTFAPAAGSVTFDAGTVGTYALKQGAANNFYTLTIATAGTDRIIQAAAASAAVDVNDVFTMTSGTYDPNGIGMEIFGNCDISAGDFTPDAAMTVTLNGSAGQTITGTAGNHYWHLTLANTGAATTTIATSTSFGIKGNYTNSSANATLNATGGTITFGGPADQTIDLQTGGDAAVDRFAAVTVANTGGAGTILAASETWTVNGALTVASGGTLQLNASTTVQFVTDTAPADSLTVNSGGTLKTSGTASATRATITRSAASGTYAFLVNGGLGLSFYRVRYCDANGMNVGAGVTDAVDGLGDGNFDGLADGDFDFPVSGNALLNFTGYDGATPAGVYGCRFSNSAGVANAKGVKGTSVGGAAVLTFFGWSGAVGGPDFEVDPSSKVDWTMTIYSILSGGTVVDNYAGVAAALAVATGANNIVESRGSGVEDLAGATLTFPNQTGIILRNAFLKNGSIQGSGGVVGNRGTLRNCFVGFTVGAQNIGNTTELDYVQNCTVVDETNTAGNKITVKGAGNGVENTILIGTGGTITASNGADAFTNKTTAIDGITTAILMDPTRYDYHLKDTAAAVINAGTALNAAHGTHGVHTFLDDIDGNPRPIGAAWDVGADEYGGAATSIPSWSTASAPGGAFMGKILSPPTYFFSTGLLYTGTTSGGTSLNNSVVLINPANGAVARSIDLATALGVVNAHPLTQPAIFRLSSGPPSQDLVGISVDTNNPADGIPDRFVCLLDIEHRAGTVSVTNSSPTVTGSGTTWQSSAPAVAAGDKFVGPDNVTYTVLTVDSDTQVTLTGNYGGGTTAGAAYRIGRLGLYSALSGGVLDSGDGGNALYQPVGQATFANDGTDNFLWIPAATSGGGTVSFCKYTLTGVRSWANATHAADYRAAAFFNRTMNRVYFAMTDDSNGYDWCSLDRDGNGTLHGTTGAATVNRFAPVWVTPGSATSWLFLAPEDSSAYAVQGATGTGAWTSPDLSGTATTACINPQFSSWVYLGVGEHVCKLNRTTGALAADGDAINEDWSTTDWLKGPISSNYVTNGAKMFFGTERGYCYQLSMVNDSTGGNDGQNAMVSGFPYRVPGARIMGSMFSIVGGNRVYFVTDDGRIVSFVF